MSKATTTVETPVVETPEVATAEPVAVTTAVATPEPTIADYEPAGAIIDRQKYVAAFAVITTALTLFSRGQTAVGQASYNGAQGLIALKRSVRRTDNGAPDYAGITDGWKKAVGTFLETWAKENSWTDQNGKVHPITETHLKQFRSRMSSMATYWQLQHRDMALYEAQTNSKSPATAAQVRDAWDKAEHGTPLPANVVATERLQMTKQVSLKGKRLQHFDPLTNVAVVNGPKPKPGDTGDGDDTGDTGDNAKAATLLKAFQLIVASLIDGTNGVLPVDAMADKLHQLTTLALLQLTGPIGERMPGADKLPGGGKGKAQAIATYDTIAGLIDAATAAMDGKRKEMTKESMVPYLWDEQPEA